MKVNVREAAKPFTMIYSRTAGPFLLWTGGSFTKTDHAPSNPAALPPPPPEHPPTPPSNPHKSDLIRQLVQCGSE